MSTGSPGPLRSPLDWDLIHLADDPNADPDEIAELRLAKRHNVPWSRLDRIELSATRSWFAAGAIEGNPIILLAGPEKRGKSWLAMQLAVAATHGGYWLDEWPLHRAGSVVYLDGEYGEYEFTRRITRIARGDGVDPTVVLAAMRHLDSRDVVLTADRENRAMRGLLKDLDENPPALVVIDPFRNHLDGDENVAKDVTAAFRVIAKIRDVARAPVLILHHVNKGGATSGSRAMPARADLIIEGTDSATPVYSTRGRILRHSDSINQDFSVEITHTHDEDDTRAATMVSRRVAASQARQDDTPRARILRALREPHTRSWLRKNIRPEIANERLGELLDELINEELIEHTTVRLGTSEFPGYVVRTAV